MATNALPPPPYPPFTPEGLKKVIPKLKADLDRILASAVPDGKKQTAKAHVNLLCDVLGSVAVNDNDPAALAGWVQDLGPKFRELTDILKAAVGSAVKTGACMYSTPQGDRCIQTSEEQCDLLDGVFAENTPCPSG